MEWNNRASWLATVRGDRIFCDLGLSLFVAGGVFGDTDHARILVWSECINTNPSHVTVRENVPNSFRPSFWLSVRGPVAKRALMLVQAHIGLRFPEVQQLTTGCLRISLQTVRLSAVPQIVCWLSGFGGTNIHIIPYRTWPSDIL